MGPETRVTQEEKILDSIAAAARPQWHRAYSFLDRGAPMARPARYWIQVVNLDGSRRWHGPALVR